MGVDTAREDVTTRCVDYSIGAGLDRFGHRRVRVEDGSDPFSIDDHVGWGCATGGHHRTAADHDRHARSVGQSWDRGAMSEEYGHPCLICLGPALLKQGIVVR